MENGEDIFHAITRESIKRKSLGGDPSDFFSFGFMFCAVMTRWKKEKKNPRL